MLSPEERPLFDALRRWRNERALRVGKPPFVLLTNQQMAKMASRRPLSLTELKEVARGKVTGLEFNVFTGARNYVSTMAFAGDAESLCLFGKVA